MPAKSPLSDRELRRLEQRLAPSNRRRALVMMKKALWRLAGRSGRLIKRLIDIVVAGAALVALSPLLLLVAAAIRLGDGGPVLFWQTRIGKWGRPFKFPKFRSGDSVPQ